LRAGGPPIRLFAWLLGLAVAAGACAEQGIRPTTAATLADSADQVLFKMSTTVTADGVRRSLVVAETAYVYQGPQKMDLRQIRVTFFDPQGKQTSVLTARTGIYQIITGTLDARKNVVVVSTDGRHLETEHLIYDKTSNQIRSDTAFVFDSPQQHGTGSSFVSDPDFKNLTVDKPKGRQRGAGILLPER